jgi:hypothetical protein
MLRPAASETGCAAAARGGARGMGDWAAVRLAAQARASDAWAGPAWGRAARRRGHGRAAACGGGAGHLPRRVATGDTPVAPSAASITIARIDRGSLPVCGMKRSVATCRARAMPARAFAAGRPAPVKRRLATDHDRCWSRRPGGPRVVAYRAPTRPGRAFAADQIAPQRAIGSGSYGDVFVVRGARGSTASDPHAPCRGPRRRAAAAPPARRPQLLRLASPAILGAIRAPSAARAPAPPGRARRDCSDPGAPPGSGSPSPGCCRRCRSPPSPARPHPHPTPPPAPAASHRPAGPAAAGRRHRGRRAEAREALQAGARLGAVGVPCSARCWRGPAVAGRLPSAPAGPPPPPPTTPPQPLTPPHPRAPMRWARWSRS